MITFRIDDRDFQRDLDRFARKSGRGFMYAVDQATMAMHRYATHKVRVLTRNAKVRSGTLIKNIVPQITNRGLTGAVISKASYSQAFEEGTRPHLIKIRKKKVLAGPKRGAPGGWPMISGDYAIYGTKVVHPGTEPRPFMFPAWRVAMRVFYNLIGKALS